MKKEQKREKRIRSKQEKGITLVALVVTIIILLILAGVTLNGALSENGLFKRAKYAAEEYNKKSIEEEIQLKLAEQELDSVNGTNRKADITSVLEGMVGDKQITKEDIEEFNKYLEKYNEKIIPIPSDTEFNKIGKEGETEYPLDGNYVQTGDFPLEGLTPVGKKEGDEVKPFTGVYNGNKHSIENLTITGTSDNTGMFGVNEGTIRNVTINNCTVTSNCSEVGAIAGKNNGVINNCDVIDGEIRCSAKKENGENWDFGGICGSNNGTISDCSNGSDNVSNYIFVRCAGGIVGRKWWTE